nr:VanZ family protein [Gorillibacterium timonense]
MVGNKPCTLRGTIGKLVIIEGTQLITRLGTFDVDDLLLNTLGAFIGFGLTRVLVKTLQKR